MAKINSELIIKNFFKDKDGHIVIWQWPNVPLWGWIIFKLLSFSIDQEQLRVGFAKLSAASLFVWAYLEITKGDSYFRRFIGGIVMLGIIAGYFRFQISK